MPRPKRVHVENGVWHVTQRATDSEVFFRDAVDFSRFAQLLRDVEAAARWRLHEYCLLTNHVHLLVQTPYPTLPSGMRRLMGEYVETFNLRHGRRGALVQGRYKAVLVESEAHYDECVRYIAENPIGARLCERPDEWPWSSYGRRADMAASDTPGPGPDTSYTDVGQRPPVLATT